MKHLRSALHIGAYALVLLAALVTLLHPDTSTDGAEAASADRAEEALASAATKATPPRPDVERAFTQRVKRVSRQAAQREARPAPVQKRVTIAPITWTSPISGYRLTGRFGDRSSMWSSGVHTGLDFAAPSGTPIRSIAAGVVKEASYDGAYGYKTVVTIPGGGEVWYCHQQRLAVSKGQRLSPGQVVGYVGTTGNVTGAHLHMEIRYGDRPVDPASVLAREGVGL
jgi:murein DD-endopeptidase MepM/ murein hydrolase activator NlpD